MRCQQPISKPHPFASPRFAHVFIIQDARGQEVVADWTAQQLCREVKKKQPALSLSTTPYNPRFTPEQAIQALRQFGIAAFAKTQQPEVQLPSFFPQSLMIMGPDADLRERMCREFKETARSGGPSPASGAAHYDLYTFDRALLSKPNNTTRVSVGPAGQICFSLNQNNPLSDVLAGFQPHFVVDRIIAELKDLRPNPRKEVAFMAPAFEAIKQQQIADWEALRPRFQSQA